MGAMENPLTGSFNRERTILTFRQRSLEVQAAYAAIFGGPAMVLVGLARGFGLFPNFPTPPIWWIAFGLAFGLAGLWAFLLFRQIRFDLRKRQYAERFGSGGAVRWRQGSVDEVRCLEIGRYSGLLPAGSSRQGGGSWGAPTGTAGGSTPMGTLLTLKLWWHDPHRPPVVVEHLVVGQAYGVNDQRTMHFLALAQAYAQALRVPLMGQI